MPLVYNYCSCCLASLHAHACNSYMLMLIMLMYTNCIYCVTLLVSINLYYSCQQRNVEFTIAAFLAVQHCSSFLTLVAN